MTDFWRLQRKWLVRLSRRNKRMDLPINQIICGDCVEVMKTFPDKSVNLVFADPPYNELTNAEVFADIYQSWLGSWVKEIKRLLVLDGSFVLCGRPPFLNYLLVKSLENFFILSDWVTWHKVDSITHSKKYFSRNYEVFTVLNFPFVERKFHIIKVKSKTQHYGKDRNIGSIWKHPKITAHHKEDAGHPTQKPEKLVGYLVKALTDVNDVVLDPFVGSGTTCVEAKKLRRKWIGIDNQLKYVEMARNRLQSVSEPIENFLPTQLLVNGG